MPGSSAQSNFADSPHLGREIIANYMDVGTTHTPQSHPQVAASQILHMHITHTFHFKLQLIQLQGFLTVEFTHTDKFHHL